MSSELLLSHSGRVTCAATLAQMFSGRLACGHQGLAQFSTSPALEVRTLFVSDMHLGMPGTASKELAHMLEHCRCERLVMIGDVIDGWALSRRWIWRERQERALDSILLHAASPGCQVTYIPGNHDDFWRLDMPTMPLGGVNFAPNLLYGLADNRQFWISHGDEHDGISSHATWLSQFGSMLYESGIHASKALKRAQQFFGFSGFSASKELKNIVKHIVQPSKQFEAMLSQDATERDGVGVLCGHIHRPQLKSMANGIIYGNTGDFVESASAIVEDFDGKLSLVHWSHKKGLVKRSYEES